MSHEQHVTKGIKGIRLRPLSLSMCHAIITTVTKQIKQMNIHDGTGHDNGVTLEGIYKNWTAFYVYI